MSEMFDSKDVGPCFSFGSSWLMIYTLILFVIPITFLLGRKQSWSGVLSSNLAREFRIFSDWLT